MYMYVCRFMYAYVCVCNVCMYVCICVRTICMRTHWRFHIWFGTPNELGGFSHLRTPSPCDCTCMWLVISCLANFNTIFVWLGNSHDLDGFFHSRISSLYDCTCMWFSDFISGGLNHDLVSGSFTHTISFVSRAHLYHQMYLLRLCDFIPGERNHDLVSGWVSHTISLVISLTYIVILWLYGYVV